MSEGFSDQDVVTAATALWREVYGDVEPKLDSGASAWSCVSDARAAVLTALAAAGRLLPEGATGEHVYLSTGCLHAQAATDPDEAKRLHGYCQSMTGVQGEKRPGQCKFCDARCVCECHKSPVAVKEGAIACTS